jgi:predicted nucleic acid-binding protein
MPPRRFVFDTNIYRYVASHPDFATQIGEDYNRVSASAVVLSELWRAARKKPARELVERLERRFEKFIFAPTYRDWREAGEYLATRFPKDGRNPTPELLTAVRKEQSDVLIALSSWNKGFVLVTCDEDFEPIRAWAKPSAGSLVKLRAPTAPL